MRVLYHRQTGRPTADERGATISARVVFGGDGVPQTIRTITAFAWFRSVAWRSVYKYNSGK